MNFNEVISQDYLLEALALLKFKKMTKVQAECFTALKQNRNILVRSKTGSGKTHAFLLPIMNDYDFNTDEVFALILAPTNELSIQIFNVLKQLVSTSKTPIDIRLYNSNVNSNLEEERLANKQPQIVVGTPGKVYELAIRRNALKIYKAKYFVCDEADMIFEEGFMQELDEISKPLADARMMFFSATFHEKIEYYIKKYLSNPIYIDLNDTFENKIEHVWIPVKHKDRLVVLNDLIDAINPYLAIVFVNKKENIPSVFKMIADKGLDVCMLHGNLEERERKRLLREIKALKYQYIVASDILARGIDIEGVSHVIQFELPYDYEFYVHRSGRCGRMGQSGTCYALYDRLSDEYLDLLAKKGVKPTYFEVVNKELVPYKGRNLREQRQKPKVDYYEIASRHIPKSKKVKPGYKKKREAEVLKLAKKLKQKEGKKYYVSKVRNSN